MSVVVHLSYMIQVPVGSVPLDWVPARQVYTGFVPVRLVPVGWIVAGAERYWQAIVRFV